MPAAGGNRVHSGALAVISTPKQTAKAKWTKPNRSSIGRWPNRSTSSPAIGEPTAPPKTSTPVTTPAKP